MKSNEKTEVIEAKFKIYLSKDQRQKLNKYKN